MKRPVHPLVKILYAPKNLALENDAVHDIHHRYAKKAIDYMIDEAKEILGEMDHRWSESDYHPGIHIFIEELKKELDDLVIDMYID